jgi:hypothetical protein
MIPIGLSLETLIARLQQSGIGVYVTHKGDYHRGIVYLKIFYNRAECAVYQITSTTLAPQCVHDAPYIPESEADNLLNKNKSWDADCWCIEIEAVTEAQKQAMLEILG